jgi:Transglycosylase SLT domain
MLTFVSASPAAPRLRRVPLPLPLLLGLGLLLLLSGTYSFYALRRVGALDREMRAMREETQHRLQKLDAGIGLESRRRQLLLGIRDEILAVNPRLDLDLAYRYSTQLVAACERYAQVDPLLLLAIGSVESGYDAAVTSPARAQGLYQIWPSTGRLLAGMLDWTYSDALLLDPEKNTTLAAFYLHILFSAYNDESLVLAEYNGGPLNAGYLRAGDGRASPETRRYVARVLEARARLRRKFETPADSPPGLHPRANARETLRLGGRPPSAPGAPPRPGAAG